MAGLDQCIVDSCEACWEESFLPGTQNRNNCSGFVKAVAKKLGVPLDETANADGIVDAISPRWKKLGSGQEAAQKAAMGVLVIAGLKGADHTPARNNGHVAIVVDGPLYKGVYPLCWCGSIGGAQSKGDKSAGEIWSRADRDNVAYYAYETQVCKPR